MGAKLEEGDWLIGHSPKEDGHKLIYAMQISEVLCMNKYFDDPRFAAKKPKLGGTYEEHCGDNIYYQDKDARWKRLPSHFHNDCYCFRQDVGTELAGRPVFVSEHFYYFGDQRVDIPEKFATVIRCGQGIQYTRDFDLSKEFGEWLKANYNSGRLGKPRDMKDLTAETDPMITDLNADCPGQNQNQESPDGRPNSQPICETWLSPRGCR